MSDTKLPKYIENANKILAVLDEQSNKVWDKTQRELGQHLGLSQPELSTLLKLLLENDRIRKGQPLPGVRGKNYTIELIDPTAFERPVARRRVSTGARSADDRVLAPGEEFSGTMRLGDISVEKVGQAVVRSLEKAWEEERHHVVLRNEQQQRIRDFREELSEERRLRSQLVTDKETLQRQLHDLEHAQKQLRAEINQVLTRPVSEKKHLRGTGGYPVRDMLDDESLRAIERLLTEKPGNYRESDLEVGLAS